MVINIFIISATCARIRDIDDDIPTNTAGRTKRRKEPAKRKK